MYELPRKYLGELSLHEKILYENNRRKVFRMYRESQQIVSEIGSRCSNCYWELYKQYNHDLIELFGAVPKKKCIDGDAGCKYLWTVEAQALLDELTRFTLYTDILCKKTVGTYSEAMSDLMHVKNHLKPVGWWVRKWTPILRKYMIMMSEKYGYIPSRWHYCNCDMKCKCCEDCVVLEDRLECATINAAYKEAEEGMKSR